MDILIRYPAAKALQALGLYYIFTTQRAAESFQYQTFPATNLCLSIYKENTVVKQVSHTQNNCLVTPGGKVQSSLWGFHKKAFDVAIDGAMDQVCIIFQAGGLRKFTRIPYAELMDETDVLGAMFGRAGYALAEQLFSTNRLAERLRLLDQFLLNALFENNRQQHLDYFLSQLEHQHPHSRVVTMAAAENKDASTLYRQFKQYVGQSPKEYLKVVRFRKALRALQQKKYTSLTDLAYGLGYYDQSHFIRDFSLFSSYNPGLIHKITAVVQEELILIPAGKNA
jgi:AraC-like DNA-binding protein